jgi:uncharacterized protein (TIGR02391 family)
MNLETQIRPDLWSAIEHSYSSENYTHAIRDAMSVVTGVLRDKSGLDGDGDKLVGQALGFSENKQPRIKINRLQTQTEQDMQRGIMLVLKGMYAFIRNPRSHERLDDDKNTADTIVLFIDYLLSFLGRSQQSFTVQRFLDMVADPHFVPDAEYVKGLVDMIPTRKRGDTLIALYRNNSWEQTNNFELVIRELVSRLTDSEVDSFLSVISEDLQKVDNVGSATLVIKVLPDELWPRIERMPRLRVEKMLLDELETAWYTPETNHTNSPASGWIYRIAGHYLRKHLLRAAIIKKLRMEDFDYHNFVATYFLARDVLPQVFEGKQQIEECVAAICDCVRAGNEFVKDTLLTYLSTSSPPEWDEEFVENLSDLTDPDNPEFYFPDGTPLLGKFVPHPNPKEEIPF